MGYKETAKTSCIRFWRHTVWKIASFFLSGIFVTNRRLSFSSIVRIFAMSLSVHKVALLELCEIESVYLSTLFNLSVLEYCSILAQNFKLYTFATFSC